MNTERLDHRQLYALLLVLAGLLLPHATRLPYWLLAALGGLFAARAWLQYRQWRMPPRWLLLPLTFALVIGVFVEYRTLFGRTGGIALLAALIGAKLLETRARRDALLLVYLGYFLVVTNFLFDQSMAMAAYLFLMVLLISTLQQSWHSLGGWSEGWAVALAQLRRAGVLLLQALPLMALLFVLFPRIEGPLWRLPQDRSGVRPGLSDSMSPGSFSHMGQDDSVAFRVSFAGERPAQSALYWRGPVFDRYDGRTWHQSPPGWQSSPLVESTGGGRPIIRYALTLEPHQRPWLLALDMPVLVPGNARFTEQFQLVGRRNVERRQLLDLQAWLQYRIGVQESAEQLARALQLPKGGNPRARAMAASWATLAPAERVNSALRFFGTQSLQYTLEPPLYGADMVDEFVFVGKRGFCEHFAGAFVFMLRAAGVPARVVGGYQGGEENGDYLIVRQADAHAWTEVWLEGEGWRRVDPTFEVAPARIQEGLGSALAAEELPYLLRMDNNLLKRTRLLLDSAVNGWNQWVIGYTPERQRQLLQQLGIRDLLSSAFLGLFLGGLFLLLAISAAWLLWRARAPRADAARQCWDVFCARLVAAGMPVGAAEAPGEVARRAAAAFPAQAAQIDALLALYLAVRYGDQPRLAQLRQQLRQLRF